MNKYWLIGLVPLAIIIIVLTVNYVQQFGKIIPSLVTGYGSIIFTNHPEGIKCWDYSADRVEFDYSSVSGSSDYSNGYLTLKADEGQVDGITCSYIDSTFIEVFPASPSESFENVGYDDWGPLAEGESVTYEYHITVVGGSTWTSGTEKSIGISCEISKCDTTVGEGNCDYYEDIDFYHATTETCS